MKKSNFNPRHQYYNTPSRSRYSSRSSRRLQTQYGGSVSSSRNRFYHRLEKACTTFSNNDVNKQISLYRKQIQKLQKQVLKKDKMIFELKQSNNHNRQIESQLVEVYRVLYMYEGKISEYQKQLKKLEKHISSQVSKDITNQVQQLLQSYRVENSELSGQLEQRNRQIMDLEVKMKKIENKYFNTVWKLSSTKRQIADPLKKRFPNLRNTITINQTPLLQKQKALKFRNRNSINRKPSQSLRQYQIGNQVKKQETGFNFNNMYTNNHMNNAKNVKNDLVSYQYRQSNSATSTPVYLAGNFQQKNAQNNLNNVQNNQNNVLSNQNKPPISTSYTPQNPISSHHNNSLSLQRPQSPQRVVQTANSQTLSTSNNSYEKYKQALQSKPLNQSAKLSSNYVSEAQRQPYRIESQNTYTNVSRPESNSPNINSQMTVYKRVQTQQITNNNNPARQLTQSMASSQQRYAISNDLSQVKNQVRQVEKRVSYAPGNSPRSIYLS